MLFRSIDDPDFDLDFHIQETSAPPPGDDKALAEQIARIDVYHTTLERVRGRLLNLVDAALEEGGE